MQRKKHASGVVATTNITNGTLQKLQGVKVVSQSQRAVEDVSEKMATDEAYTKVNATVLVVDVKW